MEFMEFCKIEQSKKNKTKWMSERMVIRSAAHKYLTLEWVWDISLWKNDSHCIMLGENSLGNIVKDLVPTCVCVCVSVYWEVKQWTGVDSYLFLFSIDLIFCNKTTLFSELCLPSLYPHDSLACLATEVWFKTSDLNQNDCNL